MTIKLKIFEFIIMPFFFISILYYFLRFQFNLDQEILFIYAFLQILIFLLFILKINHFTHFKHSEISKILLIFFFHTIFLTILTTIKTLSIDAFLYSLKDYLFPVVLFWVVVMFKIKYLNQLKLFHFISFLVSVIYLTDFILKIIFKQNSLVYLEKIRTLTIEKTNSNDLSGTFISGDLFDFIRFEGPLGHNSATSIFIAIGVFIGFNLFKSYKKPYQLFFLIINSITLIICANRTAIFSLLFTFFIINFLNKNKLKPINQTFKLTILASIFLFFISFLSNYFAINDLFSFDSFSRALNFILFDNNEIVLFINSLYNPFSWIGTGFPNPTMSKLYLLKSFRSDDFFVLQILNTYGIFSFFLFFFLIRSLKNHFNKYHLDNIMFKIYFGIVIILMFSSLHAGSLIRPQIYPIFFFSLAALHSLILNSKKNTIENFNITK